MPENVRARGRISAIMRALKEDTGEEVTPISDKFKILKVKLVGRRVDTEEPIEVKTDEEGRTFTVGELALLHSVKEKTVTAGATIREPEEGVNIARYRLKTFSVKSDYALECAIEVSDDATEWDEYYSFTASAGGLSTYSFEEDFFYARIRVYNPDSADHWLTLRIKGRT